MTHLILDAGEMDTWQRHHSGGLLVPAQSRPTVLQRDRATAEGECLRLAQHKAGLFVIFAPVAMGKRVPETTHVNMNGLPVRHRHVARLLTVAGGGWDDDVPF